MPILGPGSIGRVQPNTLVRFRGMVQDMVGNEFYVGAYQVKFLSFFVSCVWFS